MCRIIREGFAKSTATVQFSRLPSSVGWVRCLLRRHRFSRRRCTRQPLMHAPLLHTRLLQHTPATAHATTAHAIAHASTAHATTAHATTAHSTTAHATAGHAIAHATNIAAVVCAHTTVSARAQVQLRVAAVEEQNQALVEAQQRALQDRYNEEKASGLFGGVHANLADHNDARKLSWPY